MQFFIGKSSVYQTIFATLQLKHIRRHFLLLQRGKTTYKR